MNDVGIIILSRFSSSRLPGKALMRIQNKRVLEYIVERLMTVVNKSQITIATSVESSDDPIEAFCKELGVSCYRGDLNNVSRRFYEACNQLDCKYGVRINGDNILLDTDVLREMIEICEEGNYNFLSNVKGRTFPKGMSVEIVDVDFYRSILSEIETSDYFMEHVMVYIYDQLDQSKHYYFMNTVEPGAAGIQLALDTKEDFDYMTKLIGRFTESHEHYNMKEIYKLWKEGLVNEDAKR